MAIAQEIERYTKLLALTPAEIDAAKVAWAEIEPHMPDLVEQFYEHLFANDVDLIFEGVDVPRLKLSQQAYWRTLFQGGFDAAYEAHVSKINIKHHAAGVELSHYVAAYGWFSERFFDIIARSELTGPFGRDDLLVATNKILYLDMMIATSSLEATFID